MQLPQCFKIKKIIKRYATSAIAEVALVRFQLRFAHLCNFVIITKFTRLASVSAVFRLCIQKNRLNVQKDWDFLTTAYSAKVSQLFPRKFSCMTCHNDNSPGILQSIGNSYDITIDHSSKL